MDKRKKFQSSKTNICNIKKINKIAHVQLHYVNCLCKLHYVNSANYSHITESEPVRWSATPHVKVFNMNCTKIAMLQQS